MSLNRNLAHGFTLIEMIVVMVLTGIIGSMVAVFIRAPVQGYVSSSQRAEMTDIADTALRRLARDIRTAVPNSVRVANCGATPCVEYLPTRAGGRYRSATPGDVLDFGLADSSFDIIGPAIIFNANDYIVTGSTQSDGNPPYSSGANGVLRAYSGGAGARVNASFNNAGATGLPSWAELPGHRFQLVDGTEKAVTYGCIGTQGTLDANQNGQASLVRYWGYGFNAIQVMPPAGGTTATLANNLSACAISYNPVNQRDALVEISLTITRGNESINLSHAIHVNNIP